MDASRDSKGFGHGKGYQYPHLFPGHFIGQQYLPTKLLDKHFYQPSDQGYEAEVTDRVSMWRKAQAQALGLEKPPETIKK
jgi:putative ATPase